MVSPERSEAGSEATVGRGKREAGSPSKLTPGGGGVRAVVSKRGVDDGNQKVGAFSSPRKKAEFIITEKKAV